MTSLLTGAILKETAFEFEVIDALLPEQTEYYTNWIYEDALCDIFDVELYSKEFYKIFDDYIKNAVKHRQNTLLLPAFTPPLDTSVGKERQNVQLTDISHNNGQWEFGFERMKEFIDHAKACGIQYFEHIHLFSQWGAQHAPNIYDRTGKRLFGSETDAMGEEYQTFLHWGYNYYYDRLTNGSFDPRSNPCGYKQYPGAAHLVYPVHSKGSCHVAPSIREKNMAEAMDDLRALHLLESCIGREKVLSLCCNFLGAPIDNKLIPTEDQLCLLRERVNKTIKEYL